MSKIELYKGDCLEVMDELIAKGIVVDVIITDPPYGTTACKWDSVIPFPEMWERLNKLIKPNGAIVLFGSEPFSSALRMSNIKCYKYDWVWEKNGNSGDFAMAKNKPLSSHENIIVFSNGSFGNGSKNRMEYNPQGLIEIDNPKEKEKKEGGVSTSHRPNRSEKTVKFTSKHKNYPKTIQKFNKEKGLHPTQKPVALMEYLIKTYTNEGELVLDFTMGSGTTGVACQNTNRDFIGIEMDDKYFKIGSDRMTENKKRIEDTVVEKGLFDE